MPDQSSFWKSETIDNLIDFSLLSPNKQSNKETNKQTNKKEHDFNCRRLPGNILGSCVADNVHYPPKFITLHGKIARCVIITLMVRQMQDDVGVDED